jgi:putative multiple sugar transport system permease protein
MKKLRESLGGDLQQVAMVMAVVVALLIFQVVNNGRMITSSNLQNIIAGNAYVFTMSIGMVMVIILGQIDLSVGSVAGFVGMMVAIAATDWGLPWWLAVILGLVLGTLIGAWQGFWLAKMGIPGFISTLAGMMIFRGLVIWVSHSISKPAPEELSWFGAGSLPDWGREATGLNMATVVLGLVGAAALVFVQVRKWQRQAASEPVRPAMWPMLVRQAVMVAVIGYLTYLFASGNPGTSFPVPGLIVGILVIFYHVLTQHTRLGRHIYAVGGNKGAAALTGVNVDRTYFFAMLNMSLLAAVAGIMFIGRSTAAGPSDGTGWELDVIAAVFIGGAAVSGGIGTVLATIVGGLFMAVLNNGLQLAGVSADQTQVIKGVVLLAAVAIDVLSKRQGGPSILGKRTPRKTAVEEEPRVPAEASKA